MYVEEAVRSVLNQSEQNLELLIIDDCSTDCTYEFVRGNFFDQRIKLFRNNSNMGAGYCRNFLLNKAVGKYVFFLDGDDFLPDRNTFKILINTAKEKLVDICGGSLYIVDKNSSVINKNIFGQFFDENGYLDYSTYQHDGGFYRFLYRLEFLKEKNIDFPNYRRMQDPIFFVNAMICAKSIFVITNCTYCYRKNHKNVKWDYAKLKDKAAAIADLLKISKDKKLAHLHYLASKNLLECISHKFDGITYTERINIFIRNIFLVDVSLVKRKWECDRVKINRFKLVFNLFLPCFNNKK